MRIIPPPQKPFPNYKWRWAVLTPTESLNDPPVFLGVLRVFNRFPNFAPSSQEIMDGLAVVQSETHTNVDLVRTRERNLVRNSGQYWKALGLLEDVTGKVLLSPFGRLLADGKITQVEFATTVVKTLELPNRRIDSNTAEWDNIDLKIKPLELILDILSYLLTANGSESSFITPFELRKIIVPLAGVKATIEECGEALIQYRHGLIDISKWPDCAPDPNDKRMVREFLIFLTNYGFCKRINNSANDNEQYLLSSISKDEIEELQKLVIAPKLEEVVRQIKITQIPANVERKRVSREVLERPYQNVFRKNVLNAFRFTCLITNVTIDNVLEAAHIVPISERGSDQVDNGLCLRSDIHQLYDSGHLRILPSGQIILSEAAYAKNNYDSLPRQINIPDFIDKQNLHWRVNYY